MKQSEVIAELKEMVVNQIERTHALQEAGTDKLSLSNSPESWNVLQCLEHLNRYADFYIESINEKLKRSTKSASSEKVFKPGYFGNKFYLDMLPKADGSVKKMKTFKSKNPTEQESGIESLEKFLDYQEEWLELLDRVKDFNLNRNNCKLTIPLIKMNLGSTLRFVIAHQERHIQQAERTMGSI